MTMMYGSVEQWNGMVSNANKRKLICGKLCKGILFKAQPLDDSPILIFNLFTFFTHERWKLSSGCVLCVFSFSGSSGNEITKQLEPRAVTRCEKNANSTN